MIRKTLAAVAVAGATFAVPAAAFAAPTYPADTASIECSALQVPVNDTFTCTVTSPDGGTNVTLTVTASVGTPTVAAADSATKPLVGTEAQFTVTAPGEVSDLIISADVDGNAVPGSVTVEVLDEDELSGTGFDSMPLAVGAGVLLVGGAAVVFAAARRRSAQNS
jgi:hypothetical protein